MKTKMACRTAFWCGVGYVALLGVMSPAVRPQGSQIPQGYNSQDWTTANADAQRDSWVRTDPYISLETMKNPAGFGVVRKAKLEDGSRPGGFVSQTTFETEAGGYKSMGYVIDSAGNAVGFDSDTSQVFWKNPLGASASTTADCSARLNAGMTRTLEEMIPTVLPYGGIELGFRIRDRQPVAGGVVGDAHQGATNIDEFSAAFGRAPGGGPNGAGFRAPPGGVFVLSRDGMLHQLSLLKGFDVLMAPTKFVPPNAVTAGLTVFDKFVYVATSNGCGDAPSGVWALNLEDSSVANWRTNGANVAGTVGPAFGTDGSAYVATGDGEVGSIADSIVSLEAKTLRVRSIFSPGKTPFVATPVVLTYPNWSPARGKDMVVAANKDGKLYLMDSVSLGGADHKTALNSSSKYTNYTTDYVPGALASWQDPEGTRWVLAPVGSAIAPETRFPVENGKVTDGAIVAFKVVEQGGALRLQPAWVSRNMMSPVPPVIVNGVVFALSSGEYHTSDASMTAAQRGEHSEPAVLYALDATTGKELWNSGTTLPSYVHSGGISLSFSTIYVTTSDDTLWSFGFPQDKD